MSRNDRSHDVQTWIDHFKHLYPEAEFYEYINTIPLAQYIDHMYHERLEETVRPRMKPHKDGTEIRVDRHKIASLYELVIADTRPIKGPYDDENGPSNTLNSVFAYFVAQLVLAAFNKAKGIDLDYFVSLSFDREHMSLLEICAISEGMVFSNAASWYLIEEFCLAKPRPLEKVLVSA